MYTVPLHPPVSLPSLFFPRSLFFICDNSSYCAVEQMVSLFMHTFCKRPPPLLVPSFIPRSLARSYLRSIYPSFFRVRSLPLTPSYPLLVEIFMLDASRVCFAVIFETFWRIRLGWTLRYVWRMSGMKPIWRRMLS